MTDSYCTWPARSSSCTKIQRGRIAAVTVADRRTGQVAKYHPAAVFVFVDLRPSTAFLKDSAQLDERGFIITDSTFHTSLKGVFAAGDVRAGSTKQLAAAPGEGTAVLLMVHQYLQSLSDLAAHCSPSRSRRPSDSYDLRQVVAASPESARAEKRCALVRGFHV